MGHWATRFLHRCRSFAALFAPCQVRFIPCRFSLNDVRHVFCGRPLVLRPDSGIQVMATDAGLTSGNRSTRPAYLSRRVFTISDRACIPDLLINSSLVTRSCHDNPRIFRIHRRWNTSRVLRILAVDFHVSRVCSAVDNTIDAYTKFDGTVNGVTIPYSRKTLENQCSFTWSRSYVKFNIRLVGDVAAKVLEIFNNPLE